MNYRPISFLLGAGFSAPMGYPIGNVLNESLQNFHKFNVKINPRTIESSARRYVNIIGKSLLGISLWKVVINSVVSEMR